MRVGWLADELPSLGGAELTQAEFRANPRGRDVEVVDCPPGNVVRGLDAYVIHNCVQYGLEDVKPLRAPLFKYVHDMWPAGDTNLRAHLLRRAHLIFTSPLHERRFPHRVRSRQVSMIPPALDLDRFRNESNGHRSGACCVGRMAYGKGVQNLEEYAEPVDVFSPDPLPDRGSLRYAGSLDPDEVPEVLNRYARFVFLPTAVEPFGRAVVEAWASGCELQVNRNVGAVHWIREDPMALGTAAEVFWRTIADG